ncbi:MAG: hypothetical protein J6U59_06975 [Alistipes sp.]|nr:hypothetical protein [Alistipes sp.]
MKRYLYILLSAIVMLAACEPVIIPETKKYVAFYFGEATAQTTENSATITAEEPYMTIDGEKYDEAKVSLEYVLGSDDDTPFTIHNSEKRDGNLIFVIDNLTPATQYTAYLVIDGGEYGKQTSEPFSFTTKEHIPEVEMTCNMAVEAKGLMATVNLSNVAYLVDGASAAIHVVKVEYKRTSAEEWIAHEFMGSVIQGGKMSVELPFEGEDYLEENRNYHLRATLYPEDVNFEPLISDIVEFKTQYAEITANIAKPTLKVNGENIRASVENIEVFYDGISMNEYHDSRKVKYYFYYRIKGNDDWTTMEVEATDGDISATISAEEGNTYEVKALIVAGAIQKARESAIAEIEVPKNETPTPPTPPVGGGDTSSIAGVWHLTVWRGAEPSFEVYMDINAEGGLMLYQRIESRYWDIYSSTAAVVDGVISGTYTDGTAWGASYNVSVEGDTMTWVSTLDSADVSVYTRSELPQEMPTEPTRSAACGKRFL